MRDKQLKLTLMVGSLFLLNSCANNNGEGPVKCIDNKPAPTGFSTTIKGLNHSIPLSQALSMTGRMSTMKDSILHAAFRGQNLIPISETFNLEAIDAIICQPNTVAFRAYLGLDQNNKLSVIFVGVNPKGQDVINTVGRVIDNPNVAEAGQRYP